MVGFIIICNNCKKEYPAKKHFSLKRGNDGYNDMDKSKFQFYELCPDGVFIYCPCGNEITI